MFTGTFSVLLLLVLIAKSNGETENETPSSAEVTSPLTTEEKELKLRPSSDPNKIKFYLYPHPEDEDDRREIQVNNFTSVLDSCYNVSRPLVILIHGVLSDSLTFPDVKIIKNEYLRERYEVNVVIVDYGAITLSLLPLSLSSLSYLTVLQGYNNTEAVASRTTDFISFLMLNNMLSGPEDVHIIGFSIGAHMAGAAGRNIFYQTNRKIKRITGLDPSPQFKSQHKLVETDAEFVDVTLTSMAFLTKFKTYAHVQFYMNGGGPHQPSCPNLTPFIDPYCSHVNSVYYYAKTIRTRKPTMGCLCDNRKCKNPPRLCGNTVVYGENVPNTARGNYYVKMN